MAGPRYTKDECILGLKAYVDVKNSNKSIGKNHPVLKELHAFYKEHMTDRPIGSLTFLMYNFQFQDTNGAKGYENISSVALSVWEQYYDPDEHTIDESRLKADAEAIKNRLVRI